MSARPIDLLFFIASSVGLYQFLSLALFILSIWNYPYILIYFTGVRSYINAYAS